MSPPKESWVYEAKEGWEALCGFLWAWKHQGQAVPAPELLWFFWRVVERVD